MSDAPQAGLDATDDDRHIAKSLTRALGVHDDGAVGPFAAHAAGRIGIVTADAPFRGVTVDHRIHVAGGNAEEQVWPAELGESAGVAPVRLRNQADAKALRLQQPADDGHAEAGVVDVSIAGYDNPSQLSQPSSSISARDMGSTGAAPNRAAQCLR